MQIVRLVQIVQKEPPPKAGGCEVTEAKTEREPSALIAELHAAGYSNAKIGYLLLDHGASMARSEGAVRSWAMRRAEPRFSDYEALQSLHAAVMAIVENYDRSPADL